MNIELPKKNILGVDVTDASKEDILKYITKSLGEKSDPYYIVTPNPEMIVAAKQNHSFPLILNQARIALPDGVGLTVAASFLGKKLKERISGTDFVELLCKEVSASNAVDTGKPITVGFLGGRNGVAERAAECLLDRYPGLKVGFIGEEWGETEGELSRRIKNYDLRFKNKDRKPLINPKSYLLNPRQIDILFVALGFPKQEEWMAKHIGKIPVQVMMGVGGAFDYLSGNVPRAPYFLRAIGLEWLYRLISQPWRLRRQLSLIRFIWLVLKMQFVKSSFSSS